MLNETTKLLGTFCVGDYIPGLAWIDRGANGVDGKAERVAERFDQFLQSLLEEHRSSKKGKIDDIIVAKILSTYCSNSKEKTEAAVRVSAMMFSKLYNPYKNPYITHS